jgi:tetratricopeptide (TPR) repeat protein
MSVKEIRMRSKLAKREEKQLKYTNRILESSMKALENEVMTLLTHKLGYMQLQYTRWKTAQNSNFQDKFEHYTDAWMHWLHYDIIQFAKDFEGVPLVQEKSSKVSLRSIKTSEQFWLSYNLYDDITPMVWRIRFTTNARNKLLQRNLADRDLVLRRLVNFSTGWLNLTKFQGEIHCKLMRVGPCAHMAFFFSIIDSNLSLVFCLELNRVPYTSNQRLIYYSLQQHLKVLSIVTSENKAVEVINNYIESISSNPDLYIESQFHGDFKQFDSQAYVRKVGNLYFPHITRKIYLTAEESENMVFDATNKKWVPMDQLKPVDIDLFSTSHPRIKSLANKQSGTNFVKLLTTIPNFRIKLTEEQNEAVKNTGNIVILGRSGTGKTTCAVLRMFAAEILFKFNNPRVNRKFGPEDVDKSSVLHTAFVTASPVLTNEVKRFYNKLNEHVKDELAKKIKKKEVADINAEDLQTEEIVAQDNYSSSDSDEEADNGPSNMNLLKDEDFPLFFTVRRLIFMVDASLRRPFFARDMSGKIIGAGTNFEWHNEHKGYLKISKDYKNQIKKSHELSDSSDSDSDEDTMENNYETEQKLKYYEDERKRRSCSRVFEVDFKVFKEKFWPKIKARTHLSALVIWTEITAYIKGSSKSFEYTGYYLPRSVYSNKGQKVSLLTKEEKEEVWDLFILYERWKVSNRGYDFQDIVNYIFGQIKYYGYSGVPLHYMMVDEVQDLTPATIALLVEITKEKLIFSGDTAQTIAKGVGFRFCDLESLFQQSELPKPTICQLTMNFRTHNQILAMANSIVSLLETLFPQTIDKMGREISQIDGPIPKIIVSQDYLHLFYILFGLEKDLSKSEIQFGCNQVIIVRNQEAKEKLHPLLSHALCLTVFEAKGLEFDDVILYNFFTDSEVSIDKWRILNSIKLQDNDSYYKPKNFEDLQQGVPKLKCLSIVNQSKLSVLCTELKHLYVAVTRPKRNLIIFDENSELRRFMQDYWDYMEVVQFVTPQDFESGIDSKYLDFKAIAQQTSAAAWKLQGERMMSHKFYDQAAKCFSVSGDTMLETKATAFAKATKASILTSQSEAGLENSANCTRKEKLELKANILQAQALFKEAADELVNISKSESSKNILKQAAQCYASAKNYSKAAQLYEEIGFKGQAAESYSSCGQYEKAADLFSDRGDYIRAIECYSLAQLWDKLLHCLHRHKDIIPSEERKKYVYKYMPVALEALMPKILPNEQGVYIRKIVEEQKNVIKEAEEEDEDDEDEEEQQEKKEDNDSDS